MQIVDVLLVKTQKVLIRTNYSCFIQKNNDKDLAHKNHMRVLHDIYKYKYVNANDYNNNKTFCTLLIFCV